MIDTKAVKRFQNEKKRRLEEASQKLLDHNDINAAKEYLDWVDTGTKLIESAQKVEIRRWSLLLSIACILLVGLAWTLRIGSTNVSINATTNYVQLTLNNKWVCSDWPCNAKVESFFVNNLTELTKLDSKSELGDNQSVAITGSKITINKLKLDKGAVIEFGFHENEISWFIKSSSLEGSLLVHQATIELLENKFPILRDDKVPPKEIYFKTAKSNTIPVELRFITIKPWKLLSWQTQKLDFSKEEPSGSGDFISTIDSAKITLQQTNITHKISENDDLILEHPQSQRLKLQQTDDNKFLVHFDGTAKKVLTGPPKFRQDITPSIFEYLFAQQQLAVFWSAVVFLGGLIWKIRYMTFLIEPKSK